MAALVDAHDRTVDLEVVVVVGVDRRDHACVPHLDQVVDHPGGGVTRVVPALEGGDHDRRDEVLGRLGAGDVLDHPTTLGPRV
jgi:hypothetical protein